MTVDLQSSNSPEDMNRREILADVNVACRTTLDILNDLLCFDKMESGILVLHRHEVPVLSFISDCVSMFSAQAREGDVTMSYTNCGGEDALDLCSLASASSLIERDTVFIDRFKMDQVLRNLISNALKFTPRGGTVNVTSHFIAHKTGISLPFGDDSQNETFVRDHGTYRCSIRLGSLMSASSHSGFCSMLSTHKRVHVSIDPDPPVTTKGRLVIIVKDTGSGMIEKDYSRLFKEIVQFNPEVLQAGGGSGLGLWITKGIVDLHQGQISVHSDGLGCGSSFTVELPMERLNVRQSENSVFSDNINSSCSLTLDMRTAPPHPLFESAVMTVKDKRDGAYNLSNELIERGVVISPRAQRVAESKENQSNVIYMKQVHHLLIVDDSPLNRKMLIRTFRAAGHTFDEAEDGVIGVAKVKEMMSSSAKAYSAILMDFVMPNMDGPTATKEIRALGYTAPIFGVTGNTLDSDKKCFTDSGADRVLPKPFDINIFDRAMQCA